MKNLLFQISLLLLLATAPSTRAEEVKIGVIMPFSGIRADSGKYTSESLALANEDLAANPGLKYSLKFILEDSRYEPAAAVTAAKKLIELDKVSFIIGAGGSSETLAIAPLAESAKVILITPGSQSDEISSAGDYIFRLIHNTAQEAPWFAGYLAGKSKSGVVYFMCIDTAGFVSYLKYFKPAFEKLGKKVSATEWVDPKETDFRPSLLRFKAKGAKEIFIGAAPAQVALALKQAHEIGLKAQFYGLGIEGPDILAAGQLAEGLKYPYSYDGGAGSSEARTFYNKFLARYQTQPDTIAANVYDAVRLLSGCFEALGIETDRVKECLYSTKNYHGASGDFSIDEHGDAVKTLLVKSVKNGQFVRSRD